MLFLVTRAPRVRSGGFGALWPRELSSPSPCWTCGPAAPTSEPGVCTLRPLLPVPMSCNHVSFFYEFALFSQIARTSEITQRLSLSVRWSFRVCDPILR